MRLFTELFLALDATSRTSEKLAALEAYFSAAAPADAAWALYFLSGGKVSRIVSTRNLREWVAEEAELPLWLIEESYEAVGDLAEALALVLPTSPPGTDESLASLVEGKLLPLAGRSPYEQRELLRTIWAEFSPSQRLVWHKLITGSFRVGVARTLVSKALAAVAKLPPATIAHRLMGKWQPSATDYQRLMQPETDDAVEPGQPYPFFLAHPLTEPLESLGPAEQWQAEWKWDGIRAQLIRRQGQTLIWSRGEELVTDRFPEVRAAGRSLPDGVVLDGEILAWQDAAPLPFGQLQTRIGRKQLTARILDNVPVVFMAYDLLELDGEDRRGMSLAGRRSMLERLLATSPRVALELSPVVRANTWDDVRTQHTEARQRRVEGLMLKRRDSVYGVGRPRGDWWKWKIDPYSIDAVLTAAQQGHGRRASLYTDYTFGLWQDGQLVNVAKAYSGLTDEEFQEVDRFIRGNTLDRFGPVRTVKPELVFELHFEGIQSSSRHKSGLAVRFPRMHRWRRDKQPAEADTLDSLRALLAVHEAHHP